jgi:hypothetical protein
MLRDYLYICANGYKAVVTALELIKKQMDETEFMLSKTFEGLTNETAGTKVGNLMTPKETVEHLTEAYIAARKHVVGEKHEWGTYKPSNPSWDNLLDELGQNRKAAADAVIAKGDDDALTSANMYIIGHDHYHIGQLCAVRLAMDPNWDAYCIYQEA